MLPNSERVAVRRAAHRASQALVACLLLAGCATVPIAGVHLPEPALPACVGEEIPGEGDTVGRYFFAPAFISHLRELLAADNGPEATMEALRCASGTAKALREAVAVIRTVNGP